MQNFILAFIPLFVALDVLGTVPLFLSLTSDSSVQMRRQLTRQAVMAAFIVALVIMIAGKTLFSLLGITIADFRVAGGIILLVISVKELVSAADNTSKMPIDPAHIGVVPLGIPLILGPAALTTLLISVDAFGFPVTFLALVINLILVFLVFFNSHWVERVLGRNGAGAFAKVSSLFMAAIAVMMIRLGLKESWQLFQ